MFPPLRIAQDKSAPYSSSRLHPTLEGPCVQPLPNPSLSALGFGILTLQVLTLLGESRQPLGTPAEACGPPHGPTSKDVWEAGRESSQQQAGWTGGGGSVIHLASGFAKSQKVGSVGCRGRAFHKDSVIPGSSSYLGKKPEGVFSKRENLPNSGQLEAVSWGPASEAC